MERQFLAPQFSPALNHILKNMIIAFRMKNFAFSLIPDYAPGADSADFQQHMIIIAARSVVIVNHWKTASRLLLCHFLHQFPLALSPNSVQSFFRKLIRKRIPHIHSRIFSHCLTISRIINLFDFFLKRIQPHLSVFA